MGIDDTDMLCAALGIDLLTVLRDAMDDTPELSRRHRARRWCALHRNTAGLRGTFWYLQDIKASDVGDASPVEWTYDRSNENHWPSAVNEFSLNLSIPCSVATFAE